MRFKNVFLWLEKSLSIVLFFAHSQTIVLFQYAVYFLLPEREKPASSTPLRRRNSNSVVKTYFVIFPNTPFLLCVTNHQPNAMEPIFVRGSTISPLVCLGTFLRYGSNTWTDWARYRTSEERVESWKFGIRRLQFLAIKLIRDFWLVQHYSEMVSSLRNTPFEIMHPCALF